MLGVERTAPTEKGANDMKNFALVAVIAAFVVVAGCATTNYPVIFDDFGPWGDTVMDSFYDQAYIVPTSQVATIWSDGTDELFSTVVQDNRADQWLYTYNNFDSTGAVMFLDQTYCDPTRQSGCAVITAWNPDYPEVYAHGDQTNEVDDPFDYNFNDSCSGARSLSMLISDSYRMGECGSSLMADPQATAFEFSLLQQVEFRGVAAYELPIDSSVASFTLTSFDNGVAEEIPIYGRFTGYLDKNLRLALPMTPNLAYQKRAVERFTSANGNRVQIDVSYGALRAEFKAEFATF